MSEAVPSSITKTLKKEVIPSAKGVLDAGKQLGNEILSLPMRAIRGIRSGVKSAVLAAIMIAGVPVSASANIVGAGAKLATTTAGAVVKAPIQGIKMGVDVVEAVAITPIRKVVHYIEARPSTQAKIDNVRAKTNSRIDAATGGLAKAFGLDTPPATPPTD